MLNAAFFTLGCRLNQAETAIMAKGIERLGYHVQENGENMDLCVINTCTVTNQSDAKCRRKIRSVQKKNPAAIIAVVGCFSQLASEKILKIGGVHLILGNREKLNLATYLPEVKPEGEPLVNVGKLSKNPFTIETIGQHLQSTRANLKIQDGCDFICSYCVIPAARGRSRPRELNNIRQEVKELVKSGVKEIILTGVNVGTYQYKEIAFIDLLNELEQIDGIMRIRISSIEPTTVGTEIFPLMREKTHKLLPYLHLPLQSANDNILKMMRRRYLFQEYKAFIHQAITDVPGICIGSDIIVGFPGETDDMFQETYNALKNNPIHYFHVFSYSEREGTTSERLKGKVPGDTINKRASIMRRLSDQKKRAFARQFRQQTVEVLFEKEELSHRWSGYSENYIRVSVESPEPLRNQIRRVRIQSINADSATGEIV